MTVLLVYFCARAAPFAMFDGLLHVQALRHRVLNADDIIGALSVYCPQACCIRAILQVVCISTST